MVGSFAVRARSQGEAQSRFDLSDEAALLLTVSRFTPQGFDGVDMDETLEDVDSTSVLEHAARLALLLAFAPIHVQHAY